MWLTSPAPKPSWEPRCDAPEGSASVKGVTYLARAFAALIAAGVRTNLTVLGGGVAAETIRSAFAPDARTHVTITERVVEAEVMAAYRTHDVLAWPSTYEGFGM